MDPALHAPSGEVGTRRAYMTLPCAHVMICQGLGRGRVHSITRGQPYPGNILDSDEAGVGRRFSPRHHASQGASRRSSASASTSTLHAPGASPERTASPGRTRHHPRATPAGDEDVRVDTRHGLRHPRPSRLHLPPRSLQRHESLPREPLRIHPEGSIGIQSPRPFRIAR